MRRKIMVDTSAASYTFAPAGLPAAPKAA